MPAQTYISYVNQCMQQQAMVAEKGGACLQGGAEGLAGQADNAWDLPLGAIVLGVRHMGLSGWQGPECMALENELTAWQQAGDFKSTETALRSVTVLYQPSTLDDSLLMTQPGPLTCAIPFNLETTPRPV